MVAGLPGSSRGNSKASKGKNWQILGAQFLDHFASNKGTHNLAKYGAAAYFLNCLAGYGLFQVT